jgi:Ser-tRNA(Ala) deacylase AlaX
MNPRLPTAEHILAKILEDKFDVKVGICKFDDIGLLEVYSHIDIREVDIKVLEKKVNEVISRDLRVNKYILPREKAKKEVDLRKVPDEIQKVRIVNIQGFDKRPCADEHVNNTSEIGKIRIQSVERVGKERYRFLFDAE